MDIHSLPTLNACLNATAFIFLCSGWLAIKNNKKKLHRTLMIGALIASGLFLSSYLTYHALVPGVTRYTGQGIARIIYFTILLTHTPLATIIVPFCAMAVYHAIKKNWTKHTQITRWLMPIWMYVSVTGVLIYLMLYIL